MCAPAPVQDLQVLRSQAMLLDEEAKSASLARKQRGRANAHHTRAEGGGGSIVREGTVFH